MLGSALPDFLRVLPKCVLGGRHWTGCGGHNGKKHGVPALRQLTIPLRTEGLTKESGE